MSLTLPPEYEEVPELRRAKCIVRLDGRVVTWVRPDSANTHEIVKFRHRLTRKEVTLARQIMRDEPPHCCT